ncbi:MAG: hypothetical protein R3A47_00125 [Polyangiales bacterium]
MLNFRVISLLVAMALVAVTGCAKNQNAVDRVGVNVVEKALFEGSWYFSRTVIDVDYEGGALGTFPGDSAYDRGSDSFASLPRIRWVIDENSLIAYRDYEILEGGNPGNNPPGSVLGQPIAAFEVLKHFDIKRGYNPASGEEQNVIEENDTDRPWYEREYMRVDWSKNLLPGYYGITADLYDLVGLFEIQDGGSLVQGSSEFPESWRPQFHRMGCESTTDESDTCTNGDRDWALDYDKDELYAFDFVTQDLYAPGEVPDPFTGAPVQWCVSAYSDAPACTTTTVFTRNSFIRVSDKRQYEPVNWTDTRFERAGFFRLENKTYDRSDDPTDPAFGQTDFKNYSANRFNIWQQWRDADGNSIPYAERDVRPIVFYISSEMPAHLVEPSFEVFGRWNEVFMHTVRALQGKPPANYPPVTCQNIDPDAYCACVEDPDTGTILNPTCPGQYDPFESPDAAAARGVVNPYDCYVAVPEEARFITLQDGTKVPLMQRLDLADEHFNPWFEATTTGSECVAVLKNNSCNLGNMVDGAAPEGVTCEERGDARYKFMSYVQQPGTGFLGIATLRGDPVTGEVIAGDANIGGPALDSYRTLALQMYDIINGDTSELDFILGEDIREYFENVDRVQLPARPQVDFLAGVEANTMNASSKAQIDERMALYEERAAGLQGAEGRASTYSDIRRKLAGSDAEKRLLSSTESLLLAGIENGPAGYGPSDLSDDIISNISPFRSSVQEQMRSQHDRDVIAGMHNIMMPNAFIDDSVLSFVNERRNWSRARLAIGLNRMLFFQTEIHELGHCLGLRHDFGGTADIHNYDNAYYEIKKNIPLPESDAFDNDNSGDLNVEEGLAYEAALNAARRKRELAGIDRYMNASIMDYTSQWYERIHTDLGRYDAAAVAFGYGDLVEIAHNEQNLPLNQIDPTNTPRVWAKYYQGGEACESAVDCPFSASGSQSGELLSANFETGLTQTCIPHPDGSASHGYVCSNFDADAASKLSPTAGSNYLPVSYLFCSDERVGSLGWCHRFDEGDSYREIVRNAAESYERSYIFNNFRRYRANFSLGGQLGRLIDRTFGNLQAIYKSLLFRYRNDYAFRNDQGPFGFYDQFLASADILNFYAKVLGQPDIGSYQYSASSGNFERIDAKPGVSSSELDIPIGLGRYLYSTYQTGLTGIQRIERIGSFYEKWVAVQMLASRDLNSAYDRDLAYWVNFYDLFPAEMQQIFQGLIQNKAEVLAPNFTCGSVSDFGKCEDPQIIYKDFYRGDCSDPSTCRPDPVKVTYANYPRIDGRSSIQLQYVAAVFALADFPTAYNPIFHQQLFVCVEGSSSCFTPVTGSVEGVDYIRFRSDRFGKTFIAWQVEPSDDIPNQRSVAFEMLEEANNNQRLIEITSRLATGGAASPADESFAESIDYELPTDAASAAQARSDFDSRQRDVESFIFQLINLEQDIGISGFLGF